MQSQNRPLTRQEKIEKAKRLFLERDRRARHEFAPFCEAVLKTEKEGDPIELSEIHRLSIRFVDACRAVGKFACLVLPLGHGKSSLFSVGYPLWWWGAVSRNAAIKLVSGLDSTVKIRVQQVRAYIAEKYSSDYRRVFPEIEPDRPEGWAKDQIFIKRDVAGFPSLWAHSVLGSGEGPRCDLLILDDCVTQANAVGADQNKSVIDAVEGTWMQRLSPGSFCICLNTPWSTRDLTAHIQANRLDRWAVLKVAVNKALDGYAVTVLGLPSFAAPPALPLWHERFGKEELERRRSGGPRIFARGYQLDPYDPAERKLPHFGDAAKAGTGLTVEILRRIYPQAAFFMGFDPGGAGRKGSSIFVLGAWKRKRFPVFIQTIQAGSQEVSRAVIEAYRRYRPYTVYIENVALQEAYIGLINAITPEPIPIVPFVTGKNKSDPTIGVEGIDAEFAQGYWQIPAGEWQGHEIGCECDWCRFRDELTNYPNYETSDVLMSLWFAWNAARGVSPGDGTEEAEAVGQTAAFRGERAPRRNEQGYHFEDDDEEDDPDDDDEDDVGGAMETSKI